MVSVTRFASSFLAATLSTTAFAQVPTHDHVIGVPQTLNDWARGAQLFDGLGTFHRQATTSSPEAQRFFDQGMRFVWAFNHDEATRSFARAAEIDPACASCWWGVALTLGPNYNMPVMADARSKAGWEALGRAKAASTRATAKERALIGALEKRFVGATALDPSNSAPPLAAYVAAMRTVAKTYPEDADVQTLFAESLMNTNPWKLWSPEGTPGPGTPDILAALQAALKIDPRHPGANHYWIHAIEASPDPAQGLAAAETLRGMMPGAGHLEHMPSHIMQRVGRYEEAAEANRKGAAADLAYLKLTAAPDYYPMYLIHNFQFLAFAAAMEGRRTETIAALRQARAAAPDAMLAGMPGIDWSIGYLYEGMIRFGMWAELLRERAPDAKLPGLSIGYAQGRATALAATGRLQEARVELDRAWMMIATVPAEAIQGQNRAAPVYAVGQKRAEARLAEASGDRERAILLLTEATAMEDTLSYNEPEDIFFPTRHLLGDSLLRAGRPAEAEEVFRADLKRHPANGWALLGLAAALQAQGRKVDAETAKLTATKAFAKADLPLTRAAY
jgi:tetratricopeptide (TPR) repeat protein